jgi:hypothetical protein
MKIIVQSPHSKSEITGGFAYVILILFVVIGAAITGSTVGVILSALALKGRL